MTQKQNTQNLPDETVEPDKQQLIAIDEFISVATHQLRTPATAVKQYLAMLLGGYVGELTEQQMKYIQSAYDSNERELQIISDLPRNKKIDNTASDSNIADKK